MDSGRLDGIIRWVGLETIWRRVREWGELIRLETALYP